ncbi:hypothetical protein, partial [Stenotrophomonas maltophilia]|uniref:hypothetical protein n=1 Tax=Stenotrophomonas maltophilia TaxID=40324 RepID=UPI00195375B3
TVESGSAVCPRNGFRGRRTSDTYRFLSFTLPYVAGLSEAGLELRRVPQSEWKRAETMPSALR